MPAEQYPRESLPEIWTENCINNWIESWIEISKPQEEASHVVVDDAVLADGHDESHDEEGKPTHHKCSRDDGERLGRFPLPLGLEAFLFLAGRVDDGLFHGQGALSHGGSAAALVLVYYLYPAYVTHVALVTVGAVVGGGGCRGLLRRHVGGTHDVDNLSIASQVGRGYLLRNGERRSFLFVPRLQVMEIVHRVYCSGGLALRQE